MKIDWAPVPKIKITLRPDAPIFDPPIVCAICDVEQPSHTFTPTEPGQRSTICSHCKRVAGRVRLLPWAAEVRWPDRVLFEDAGIALRLLERAI